MKKLKAFLLIFTTMLLSARSVLAEATCKINNQVVPCDQLPQWFSWAPWVMFIIFLPLSILFFIFWIKMLIHAIEHQKENKVVWVLVIVLLQVLGAIIYYFTEKRPSDKKLITKK